MNFSGLKLITPPASDPVTVSDAKAHCRAFGITFEDSLIAGYIRMATMACENKTMPRRAFMPQTWQVTFEHFPGRGERNRDECNVGDFAKRNRIEIPKPPLVSIVSFTYTDTAGNVLSMTEGYGNQVGNYILNTSPEPGRVELPFSGIWPTTILLPGSPIQITFNCGYAAYAGTVNIDASGTVSWVSGDTFDTKLSGTYVNIGGGSCTVASITDPHNMRVVLSSPAPITFPATGVAFTGNAVPMPFRSAILFLAAHLYDNREPVVTGRGITAVEIPDTIDAMLAIGD